MDMSIILVSYNTKDLTRNCLNSLYEKTTGLEFEIFVVDNNSKDGSPDMVEQEFPDVKLIRNSDNKGFGAANNIAVRQAQGKYIFCLNTDTLLVNNAINIMFDFMEKEENQNVGVCGGLLMDKDKNPYGYGGKLPSITDILWKFGFRQLFKEQYKKYLRGFDFKEGKCVYDIGYICGADIMFRKSVLDMVGLFDENFFMYFEESELCKRIKNKGYDIKLLTEPKIIHLEGSSCKNALLTKKRFKKSEAYYYSKHMPYLSFLLKILNITLYLTDWLFLKNKDGKEMIKFILRGYKD